MSNDVSSYPFGHVVEPCCDAYILEAYIHPFLFWGEKKDGEQLLITYSLFVFSFLAVSIKLSNKSNINGKSRSFLC